MQKKPLYYSDYLNLDQVLNAQSRLTEEQGSPVHDETLFITSHQIFELWFKQILIELDSVINLLNNYSSEQSFAKIISRLTRITVIQKTLLNSFDVLKTMSPMDFLEFRDALTPSSGFQSLQFRLIETRLGVLRDKQFALNEKDQALLNEAQAKPTLFSSIEKWLCELTVVEEGNTLFWTQLQSAVEKSLSNDQQVSAFFNANTHQELQEQNLIRFDFDALRNALLVFLYKDKTHCYNAYQVLSLLTDIDDLFTAWRHTHVWLVQRMIGEKIGTGGSPGLAYLKASADNYRVFSDITALVSCLIPGSALPEV